MDIQEFCKCLGLPPPNMEIYKKLYKQLEDKEYKTKVVNVKVGNIRPKYDNLKEWCNDPNNVYIGRQGIVFINNERFPKQASIWANPFKVIKDDRDDSLSKYGDYIVNKIKIENLTSELYKLKGNNLGCWCYPEKCHGDVLVKLINNI